MGIRVEGQIRIGWVPDGAGGAALGQQQANVAGTTSTLGPGVIFNAQVLQLIQAEGVNGGDTPTQAQIQAAVTQMATDLNAQITTAVTATINGWATGSP